MSKASFLTLLIGVTLFYPVSSQSPESYPSELPSQSSFTGKYLVRFHEFPCPESTLEEFVATTGWEIYHRPSVLLPANGNYTYVFYSPSEPFTDPETEALHWQSVFANEVALVEPDYAHFKPGNCLQQSEMVMYPNQPDKLWHIYNGANTVWNNQYGQLDADADICECWSQGYTGQNIKIGIIDFDGFEFNHEDLSGQLAGGWNCMANAPLNQTFYDNTTTSHGMATLGVIGAKANNNRGTIGVAYDAQLIPYLISGTTAEVIIALQKSLLANLDVLNMSFYSTYSSPSLLNEVMQCAQLGRVINGVSKGAVMVAAAGNENTNQSPRYPAAWDDVIGVGASNPDDFRAKQGDNWGNWNNGGSNYGPYYDIVAPGAVMYTLDYMGYQGYSGSNYVNLNGTSFSAPIVSGIVAILLQKNPELGLSQIQDILSDNAVQVHPEQYNYNYDSGNPGRSLEMQFGRVSCINSLQSIPLSTEIPSSSGLYVISMGENWIIRNNDTETKKGYIFTSLGQLVSVFSVYSGENIVSHQNYASGIYTIVVTGLKDRHIEKVLTYSPD